MKRNLKLVLTVTITLSCFSISSFGQDDSKTNASNQSLSMLFNCAEIAWDLERLACQYAEIKTLKNSTEAKILVVFDEKSVKDIKKKSFGFSLPKLGLLDLSDPSEKNEAVLLPVK